MRRNMNTLHVLPHGQSSGFARELDLLLSAMPSPVCCLGVEGHASRRWRAAGIDVEVLNWRRMLDPKPLWKLARRIREVQPEVIYVWGLVALRAVRMTALQCGAAMVVRRPLTSSTRRGFSAFERWLLRGVDRVLASSGAEARACLAAGLTEDKVQIVPPGVGDSGIVSGSRTGDDRPRILCAGALERSKGFYEAIWAFDILHFTDDNVELLIAGVGPERRRLEDFARRTGLQHRIHLLGEVADISPFLAQASLVWVPSLCDRGAAMVLEGMTAGRPVIASRWPGLAELVLDGETGFLVEPGSKIGLAQKTRQLLVDRGMLQAMAEAGRRRACALFSQNGFADSWRRACRAAVA
jgi:glycosyltransferase involved in cell wall biosynthesis